MAKGDYLGEFEQLVLLALLQLKDQAYGVAIRQEIMFLALFCFKPGTITVHCG